MNKKFKVDKYNILVLIIGLLSFGNIVLQFTFHGSKYNYPSIINSVVGLAGVVLFFLKKDIFRYFVWVWIFAQAIIIDQTVIDSTRHLLAKRPVFDLSQILNLKFGIHSFGPNGSS